MGKSVQHPFATCFSQFVVLWARRGLSTGNRKRSGLHVDNRSSVHRVVAIQLNSPFLRVSMVFFKSKS